MAYRRNFRNRRGNRRFGRKKQTSGYMGMAFKAYKIAKYLAGVINVEHKEHEIVSSGSQNTTASIHLLSGIDQGDTKSTRNGNSIRAKKLNVKWVWPHTVTTPQTGRCMIIYDKVSDGTVPLVSEIFDTTNTSSLDIAHYNTDNAGSRFKILFNKRFQFSPDGNEISQFSCNLRLNSHIKYTGTTGIQANCNTGHYYMLMWYSDATSPATYRYSSVLRYIDN